MSGLGAPVDTLSIKRYRSQPQPQIKFACLFVWLLTSLLLASSPSDPAAPLWRRISSRLIGSDGLSGEFVRGDDAALARPLQYGVKKPRVGLMKS